MRLRSPRPRARSRGFFVRFKPRGESASPGGESRGARTRLGAWETKGRRGITLFEVVVSVAIFLMSVALTAQILSQGGERAMLIEHRNEAMHLCESQMARVIAGVVALTSQEDFTPFEHKPDYQWRMTAEPAEMTGLYNVQICVQHVHDGPNSEVQLCQKVFDPKNRGSTADKPGATTGTDGSSGSQTPASGTSGGN